ncbi:MAG: GAF domain-containing protein [Phycisphaerales bacterium]|nr:GAF domain-containing protein [Phycisphaerales bacterium]
MSSGFPESNELVRDIQLDRHELLLVGGGQTASTALRTLLTAAGGIGVKLCTRVNDAADEAIRVCPTVILIDLRQSGFDGLDILATLKRSSEIGAVPIMMLASVETSGIRDAAFAGGTTDFLVFPVSTTELVARIRTHSTGYLNVIKRNRSVSAYESLQSELRSANRALEESRRSVDTRSADPLDSEWQLRLSGLMQVGIELNQVQDFHSLMDRILSEARHLLHAQAGTIFLREGDALRFAFFQNEALAQRTVTGDPPHVSSFRVPVTDRSIAGWVCLTGQPLHVPDCYRIPVGSPYRFDSSFDQLLGYRSCAMIAMPLKNHAGKILGVIELINPIHSDGSFRAGFSEQDIHLLDHFASIATVAIERAHLKENTILRMIKMAEIRDPAETGGHVERVAGYAAVIFEEWSRRRGLEGIAFERQRDRLRTAAKLHDVGKIGVPDSILKKPGKLDPEEFEAVKRHTQIGGDLFSNNPSDLDDAAREVALLHHERWDGQGYPGIEENGVLRGRRGEEIPLFARIVGLSDVFDALSTHRCYKDAWPEPRVLELIQSESHGHFDPELVEIFFAQLDSIRHVRDAHQDHPAQGS